jgi:rhomboid family GlyGly-CTERM serine protease
VTTEEAHRQRHRSLRLPWRSLALGAAAAAAYLTLGPAPEGWIYDRGAIAHAEWWRLLTGHWVHSDPGHARWNITALMVAGIAFEARLGWRLLLALLLATAGVNAWLWWGEPGLQHYCGLSGILNGLLAAGLLQLWRDLRHPVVLLTACGVALKIVVEASLGQALMTQTAWPSVPATHAVGFLCGLAAAWMPGGSAFRRLPSGGRLRGGILGFESDHGATRKPRHEEDHPAERIARGRGPAGIRIGYLPAAHSDRA